jgi:hypothetical protein
MYLAELKKEMEVFAVGLKKSLQEEMRSEEFAEREAERLDNIFKQTLKEKLELIMPNYESDTEKPDLEKVSFFYEIYEDYNEKKGEEYEAMYYELNGNWFKIQLEILQLDCDDYEMDYTMGSELRKIFSEDPDNRRERLEGPLQRKLLAIDRELEILEEKKEENRYYEVKLNKENFNDFFAELEKLTNAG